jgi:hypothetical protein
MSCLRMSMERIPTSVSDMQSEKARNHKDYDHDADNVEDIHRFAPIETCTAWKSAGPVAGLVGIEGGVVSGVINLESPGVEAPGWRPRHDKRYHEV